MSVTRGAFLKSLGKSLPGLVLGSGAAAAQKLFTKMAAAAGEPATPPAKIAAAPPQEIKPAPLEIIDHGPPDRNRIALTFDDGPTPGVTDRILDELKKRAAHATFFMIGQRIAAAPDLARRVVAEGHEIANHTFTHPKLSQLSDAQAAAEIQKTLDLMADLLGVRPTWFRPPYLAFRQDQGHLVFSRGMRIVAGNVNPSDWSQPGEDHILGVIVRDTQPGSIIICHDMHAQTANAASPMLDRLLERGLAPVTMSTLME
jgi:peptidoglycan-N-acetylglucosamine deacetylase